MPDTVESTQVIDPKVASTEEPKAVVQPPKGEPKPEWLDARLAQARKSAEVDLLKALGAENTEEAKAALTELKTRREAAKSAEEKAADLGTKLSAAEKDKAEYAEALKAFATAQLASLTPEQKAALEAIAGSDPAKQIKAYAALSATWKPTVTEVVTPVTKPVVVDTANPRNAPAPAGLTTEEDPKAKYERGAVINPFAAAQYAVTQNSIYEKK